MGHRQVRISFSLVLVFALLLITGSIGFAQEPEVVVGDKSVLPGATFVLRSGQELHGNLAVLGGVARIEEGAVIRGNLAVFSGSVSIDGRVIGNCAVFGGGLSLGESAVIEGNLAAFGPVERAPGARVLGNEAGRPDVGRLFGPDQSEVIPPTNNVLNGFGDTAARFFFGLLRLALTTIAMGILGLVVALFLPVQTRNAAMTAGNAPVLSAGLGCLTLPAAIALTILLAITIVGILAIPFLWIALVIAGLFGWVAIGFLVGERLLRAADVRSPRPAASAAIGTAVLTFANSLIDVVPVVGWLFGLFVVSWAVGAVVLSRAGTQRYPSQPRVKMDDAPLIEPLDDDLFGPVRGAGAPPPPPRGGGAEGLFSDLENLTTPGPPAPPPTDEPPKDG